MLMPSMRQPCSEKDSSLPIRQRNTMLWPAAAGKLTVVVTKPAELPLQAWRPPIGLSNCTGIVALYPPAAKLPPAARMSWKAPPSVEISSTPPSKSSSRLRFCRKVRIVKALGIAMGGESSRLSLITAGSSTKAALGSESTGGVGVPAFEVTQSGAGPSAFAAVHPAGSAGGVTPSKFSLNSATNGPTTATDAESVPPSASDDVNEAVLLSVAPHVPLVVLVVT